MPTTRSRVRRHVSETPGVHFNQLKRDLDLATGQVQYHLKRLVDDEELAVERVCGRTHYFEPEFDAWERRTLAFLRREMAREIIFRVHAEESIQPATLTEELDLARSTVAWHVSNLTEADVLVKSDGRPIDVRLAHPERTAELFETVSPSLPDRLVDRFMRTVDSLLEDAADHPEN